MKRTSQSDYDLSKVSDRYKYVDAINKRIKRFYTMYGADSTIYKKERDHLQVLMANDPSMVKIKDNGLIQLSKAKQYLNDKKNFTILEKQNYLNRYTAQEYLDTTFRKMKERGELDPLLKMNQIVNGGDVDFIQGAPDASGNYPKLKVKEYVIAYANEVANLGETIREEYSILYGHEDDPEVQQAINNLQLTGRRNTVAELQQVVGAIRKVKNAEDVIDAEISDAML